MLKESSLKHPNKVAIVCGDRHFTFKEIDDSSSRLANFFISQGLPKGARIGIFSTKDIEEIIAIFAVLKIGGIFVHINPQYKENQLLHLISDCEIKFLFINNIKAPVLAKAYPQKSPLQFVISLSPEVSLNKDVFTNVFYLMDILDKWSPKTVLCDNLKEDDAASIIYTSGSSGMPKGVIVTHRIFYDSTVISASILKNTANDRLISVTPFSFDGALSQLFTMIFVGGTLVLQKSNFPKDIVDTLITQNITGFHGVPSLWRMLLQKYSPFAKHSFPNLRYVSIIGEVFPEKYLFKLKDILKETKFYMMYGITEAFRSTFLSPDDFDEKPSSVGKPFPGVEISIIDEFGRICSPGEVGQIVHKGLFISPGYWNDISRSSEVFKENSLYTGDLGMLDDDGYLYFVGRKDGMIKAEGYRISPEEVEGCLYQMDEIEDAAVVGIFDEKLGGNIIKAIISIVNGSNLTPGDVIRHCKKLLPAYMIPRLFEFRNTLPKTATNKIDKSNLK